MIEKNKMTYTELDADTLTRLVACAKDEDRADGDVVIRAIKQFSEVVTADECAALGERAGKTRKYVRVRENTEDMIFAAKGRLKNVPVWQVVAACLVRYLNAA